MEPFNHWIYRPCKVCYNKLLGRPQSDGAAGLEGRTVDLMVSAAECMLPVGYVAFTVFVLYRISTLKHRLVAATLLNLGFLFMIVFLSKQAMKSFTLTAAYVY
jgi:hypothetical protein